MASVGMSHAIVIGGALDTQPMVCIWVEDATSPVAIIIVAASLAARFKFSLLVAKGEAGLATAPARVTADAGSRFAAVRVVGIAGCVATLALELPLCDDTEVFATKSILTAVGVIPALNAVASVTNRSGCVTRSALVLADTFPVLADVCVRSA